VFLGVSLDRADDHAYFEAIWDQLDNGGVAGLLHDLMQMDIVKWNFRTIPDSVGLQEQKQLSLSTENAWWVEVLQHGYLDHSRPGLEEKFGVWMDHVSTDHLFASYNAFATARRE
jgi:hypothetical protein